MESISRDSPSPELTRANTLINAGCGHIQKLLEPENGRVSPVNLECSLHLLEKALKAHRAMDRAAYDEVERLMDWTEVPS